MDASTEAHLPSALIAAIVVLAAVVMLGVSMPAVGPRHAAAQAAANDLADDMTVDVYLPIVDRPPVPPVCSEVLINGGFEQGPGVGWEEESTVGLPVVRRSLPRNGAWGAWLGGYDLALDVLDQTELVAHWPPDGGLKGDMLRAEFSFSWRVHSAEDENSPADLMSVSLINPDGVDLEDIVQLSSANQRRVWRTSRTDVTWLLRQQANWHRSRLRFRATTDSTSYTSWYIDDVQLSVCLRGLDAGQPPTPAPE